MYVPLVALIERSQMRPYHKKLEAETKRQHRNMLHNLG